MFEEDCRENLRICLAMAPQYCGACGDFHLAVAVRRSAPSPERTGIDFDRQVFVALMAEALELRRRWKAPLTVLIAGAADTAILKLVVDAAVSVGGSPFARSLDVTVVDLCETPLEMCRVFAERNGLAIATERVDIGSFQPGRRYGLVAMHSVLPFFPVDRRLDYMRHIVSWLDEHGLVVSSSQIGEGAASTGADKEIASHRAMLEAFLSNDRGNPVDREAMFARLARAATIRSAYPPVFRDEAALQSFYSNAGLALLDRRVVAAGISRQYKQRVVVLGKVA